MHICKLLCNPPPPPSYCCCSPSFQPSEYVHVRAETSAKYKLLQILDNRSTDPNEFYILYEPTFECIAHIFSTTRKSNLATTQKQTASKKAHSCTLLSWTVSEVTCSDSTEQFVTANILLPLNLFVIKRPKILPSWPFLNVRFKSMVTVKVWHPDRNSEKIHHTNQSL